MKFLQATAETSTWPAYVKKADIRAILVKKYKNSELFITTQEKIKQITAIVRHSNSSQNLLMSHQLLHKIFLEHVQRFRSSKSLNQCHIGFSHYKLNISSCQ